MENYIRVQGARVNNLKNISVDIPRDKLVVLTGLSGCGESAAGVRLDLCRGPAPPRRAAVQLRAHVHLGRWTKPDGEDHRQAGPPPSASARRPPAATPAPPSARSLETDDISASFMGEMRHASTARNRGSRDPPPDRRPDRSTQIRQRRPSAQDFGAAPPSRAARRASIRRSSEDARRGGYARVRVDGSLYELTEEIQLDKNKKHHIEVVIDRLMMKPDLARRLTDSVETASNLSGGLVILNEIDGDKDTLFSQTYACETCGISMPELSPRMFSFNNPYGACPVCAGLGTQQVADPMLIIPDRSKSILQGAIQASGWNNVRDDSIARMYFEALAKKYHFSLNDPIEALPQKALDVILYGTGTEKLTIYYERANGRGTIERPFEGVVNNVSRRLTETQSDAMRKELEECMSERPCPKCRGRRLSDISLAVTVGGMNIMDFCALPIGEELEFIDNLKLTGSMAVIAEQIVREIRSRLSFLQAVGLSYLTLSRAAATLSGGESQRIRLATQIGSSLIGVLYILDEPSIGLHQRDNDKLLDTLQAACATSATPSSSSSMTRTPCAPPTIIVDVGPGAGVHGGEIIAAGTIDDIIAAPRSITGQYLSGARKDSAAREAAGGQRKVPENFRLRRKITCGTSTQRFPLGTFIAVTGVSGSGKSSLVNEILS